MLVVEAPNIQTSKNASVTRLVDKIKEQDAALEVFRKRQEQFVSRFCGPLYGKGFDGHEPLQMLYSVVTVLVPNLLIDPESMVTAEDADYAPFADICRANLNRTLREMLFGDTMEGVLTDTLFMIGITKTGVCDRYSRHHDDKGNYIADPGRVFSERVKFCNWIGDLTNDSPGEMAFQGDRYLMDLDYARDLYRRRPKDVEAAGSADLYPAEYRTDEIATGKRSMEDYLIKQAQFADIWLPREKVIVTIAGNPDAVGQDYIHEREYTGSEFGPYDYFQLGRVPDNFLQIPLMSVIFHLHELMNSVARKIQRQAERQKDLIIVPWSKPEDANAVKNANDGDVVAVSDPSLIKGISMGGANNVNYQVIAWLHDYLNRTLGNPDLLGGMGPQANTLGQDEMNRASATVRIAYWRKKLMDTAGQVVKKIARYNWDDPTLRRNLTVVTNTGVEVPVTWKPRFRKGDFEDYIYAIDIYSKKSADPDQQYQRLVRFLNEIVFPMQQIGAAQGQLLQPAEIVKVAGDLVGIRQAGRMFRQGMPLRMQGGGMGGAEKPRTAYADNRVVRRLPAKPEAVENETEMVGVET